MKAQQQDAKQKKAQELLRAAKRLIDQGENFNTMRVEDLCRATGIARSTFYVYFDDKNDLVQTLIRELMQNYYTMAENWWELAGTASLDEMQQNLEIFCQHVVNERSIELIIDHSCSANDNIAREREKFIEELTHRAQQAIMKSQENGFVSASVTPETIDCLLSMVNGTINKRLTTRSQHDIKRYSKAMAETIFAVLHQQSTPST